METIRSVEAKDLAPTNILYAAWPTMQLDLVISWNQDADRGHGILNPAMHYTIHVSGNAGNDWETPSIHANRNKGRQKED